MSGGYTIPIKPDKKRRTARQIPHNINHKPVLSSQEK